jgi:hypothetical protein
MAVMSPGAMVRFASRRWENWHRGTSLEVEGVADEGVRLALAFPAGLFDPLMQRMYAEAFTAALELSNAAFPAVTLVESGPERARYLARW